MKSVQLVFLGLLIPTLAEYIPPGPKYRCPREISYLFPCSCTKESDAGLYITCENSNLASLSLAFTNLANEGAPIEQLTLYKCDIARFYGPALYPLDVRVLKIERTPLKLIEEYSFLGVNRTLEELHIIDSELEKFPREALQILGNLMILKISGHKIVALAGNTFAGSMAAGKLEKLIISNGTLSSLPTDALTPLRKLKYLDFHSNNITELKRNQFKGLRDVEFLDLSSNFIDKLDPSHLADLTKMGWCNLSSNAISELKRGTFARNTVLKVLNLNDNKIRKLDSNTFRGMRFLRRLALNNNEISDIGRGTFGTISKIGIIQLANNNIKKIDFQMFSQLQFAELIDVSYNDITIIEKLSFKDLFLTEINLSHNEIVKIETGAFENCANITILNLSYNKLDNISKYAFDSTTYATELQLSYNFLTELNQVPLQNMTGLKILNVSFNNIHTIPRNTFPKLYELHTIDLSHNNISEIYNGIFQTLFSLRYLNLSYNSLERIKPSTFGSLPTLLELNLSYNKLKEIAKGSLANLASCRILTVKKNHLSKIFQLPISLGYLDFSDNKLKEIPTSEVWPTMNALLSLDLSRNLLADNLQFGSFEGLLTLRSINLQSNNITVPPWAALSTLNSLQHLNMQNNELTSLNKAAFGRLPIVFELNLAHNKIETITTRAFDGLLQLLTLNLTHNKIRNIPNEAFKNLVSLRTLDLSHNELQSINNKTHGLLDDCLSLERVNLSHNRFAYLTKKTFPSDPYIPFKLREIDLSYNKMPVLTLDIIHGTKKVVFLNLSHNNINEIRKYVIGNLTSLETLDLSFNSLHDISGVDVFKTPENLTNLYLSHNRFAHLPMDKLKLVPRLSVLDLEANLFHNFDKNLMEMIKNDIKVKYSNNPLNCDCYFRPLRRWLTSLTEIPREWSNLTCSNPNYLSGKLISDISEEFMTCGEREILENPDFEISPDIKFRSIEFDENMWKVRWFVTSRRDVGDFYIIIREIGGSKPIFEKDIGYNERTIKIDDNFQSSNIKYELCILARDSIGNVKHFRNSQCQILNKGINNLSSKSVIINIKLILIISLLVSVIM